MTPKESIRRVLENCTPADWNNGAAEAFLEECSVCAIILTEEDPLLSKSTHPDLVKSGYTIPTQFNIKARYDAAHITLMDFDVRNYLV